MGRVEENIALWHRSCLAFKENKLDESLRLLNETTEPNAKIVYNKAIINMCRKDLDTAMQNLNEAVERDPLLAIGNFQRGVLSYLVGFYPEALADFEHALSKLHGKPLIDYKQLGLPLRIFACEINHNIRLAAEKAGESNTAASAKGAAADTATHYTKRHARLTSREKLPLFEATLAPFEPPPAKVMALRKQEFMGKSELKVALFEDDTSVGFQGEKHLKALQESSRAKAPPPSRPAMTAEALKRLAVARGVARKSQVFGTHEAQHDYMARADDEVTLQMGDVITVRHELSEGWCQGLNHRTRATGMLPFNFLKKIDYSDLERPRSNSPSRPPPPAHSPKGGARFMQSAPVSRGSSSPPLRPQARTSPSTPSVPPQSPSSVASSHRLRGTTSSRVPPPPSTPPPSRRQAQAAQGQRALRPPKPSRPEAPTTTASSSLGSPGASSLSSSSASSSAARSLTVTGRPPPPRLPPPPASSSLRCAHATEGRAGTKPSKPPPPPKPSLAKGVHADLAGAVKARRQTLEATVPSTPTASHARAHGPPKPPIPSGKSTLTGSRGGPSGCEKGGTDTSGGSGSNTAPPWLAAKSPSAPSGIGGGSVNHRMKAFQAIGNSNSTSSGDKAAGAIGCRNNAGGNTPGFTSNTGGATSRRPPGKAKGPPTPPAKAAVGSSADGGSGIAVKKLKLVITVEGEDYTARVKTGQSLGAFTKKVFETIDCDEEDTMAVWYRLAPEQPLLKLSDESHLRFLESQANASCAICVTVKPSSS